MTYDIDRMIERGVCLNPWECPSPWCPDHTPINTWDHREWPVVADTDPWWDGLQSQSDYRRMHRYFDVRGGTVSW